MKQGSVRGVKILLFKKGKERDVYYSGGKQKEEYVLTGLSDRSKILLTDVNGMSFVLIVFGVGGLSLVDCHTLCMWESLEELSKLVSSGRGEFYKYGGEDNEGNWKWRGERLL